MAIFLQNSQTMPMFPSNDPEFSVARPKIYTDSKVLKTIMFISYFVIVFCWLVINFINIFYPNIIYDSPIVAIYLVNNEIVTNNSLDLSEVNPFIRAFDFYIKVIILIMGGIIGTLFLIIFMWPKIKKKNIWVLLLLVCIGYILPNAISFWSAFFGSSLYKMVTVNRILVDIINTPLTWSLILFGYYLYEEITDGS